MINNETSTGHLEDLLEAIKQAELLVSHFESYLMREDIDPQKRMSIQIIKTQYTALRRQLMSAFKSLIGEDFDDKLWCCIKHSLKVEGLLIEVSQADSNFQSFAKWSHKLESQTVGLASGLSLEDCASCIADQLLAKVKGKDERTE